MSHDFPIRQLFLFTVKALSFGLAAICVSYKVVDAEKPKPTTNSKSAAAIADLPSGRTFPVLDRSNIEIRIHEVLAEPAEIDYVDTSLGDMARDLSTRYHIPVGVDHAALTIDGKGSETRLTLSSKGVSLRSTLRRLLVEQGLTYVIENETLLITTTTAAETRTPTRFYQVHDLVLFPTERTLANPGLDPLLDLVTSTIEPETWREAGGTQGDLQAFVGPGIIGIVVTQTAEVHEQIEALLTMLRAAREPKLLKLQRLSPPSNGSDDLKPKSIHGTGSRPSSKGMGGFF